jgi:hypothetical protein
MVTPAAKREAVAHLQALLDVSERRACRVIHDIAPNDGDYFAKLANPSTLRYARSDLIHAGYARQREG